MQKVKQFFAPLLVLLAALGSKLGMLLPLLKMGGSMVFMAWVYARFYGWQFAVGIVVLIFVHEMGHLIAARLVGIPVSLPLFIPFMGASILMREMPRNAWMEAIVGIGGPILGSIGAAAVATLYFYTGRELFLVLAYFGFFINLFNLIPIIPLDGGRIVSAISPWLWIIGICILIPYLLYRAVSGSPIAILFAIVVVYLVYRSSYRIKALFTGRADPAHARYFECTPVQRWTMGILYFGLAIGLFTGMGFIRNLLPPGAL
jgi:Zn-dependent protease